MGMVRDICNDTVWLDRASGVVISWCSVRTGRNMLQQRMARVGPGQRTAFAGSSGRYSKHHV